MDATLSLYSLTLAVGDPTSNSNPSLRAVDWKRQMVGIPVKNPSTRPYEIAPGETLTLFDGTRAVTLDGTSAFSLALSNLAPDRYRIAFTGGTDPTFRTDRALDLSTIALTLAVLANGSLTMTAAGSSSPFAAVQVGDEVFIPGILTGDVASPFNPINEGQWTVIGASAQTLTLTRPAGQNFSGYGETVTPTSAAQLLGYSAVGVQVGDSLQVSAGFGALAQKSYTVLGVTSKWIEVQSTTPLAAETGATPGAAGMAFYSNSKRYLRVEFDQEVVVRVNGDAGNSQRVMPWAPGDPQTVGEFVRAGPVWSLAVYNPSAVSANIFVVSVE